MIYGKLAKVQNDLKAPKGQYNSFGKYKYRSCEDILEAAKPLCIDNGLLLTIQDELKLVGERYYIVAIARVTDIEDGTTHSVTAFAREEETKKGMDGSQITGAASSYARKYALNGLFCIDDTKDHDSNEKTTERENNVKNDKEEEIVSVVTEADLNRVVKIAERKGITKENVEDYVNKKYNVSLSNITSAQYAEMIKYISSKPDKEQ